MTITMKQKEMDIKIKNPCIEEFIPLAIEKGSAVSHPGNPNLYKIHDKSIDDTATFYTASIKLGDKEIGEFHTRYVVNWCAKADEDNSKHVTNFFNPLKSFEHNTFSFWENCIRFNKNDKFLTLVKEGKDYVFKQCDKNGGNITPDKKFIFSSNLINFDKEYIKDLSDLSEKVGSVYLITRSKLYKHFNDWEDNLLTHPAEIREYSVKDNIAIPGKLIGTINHEYGIFRESASGDKREFIFSDAVTKGKNIVMTDKDRISHPKSENEDETVKPEGFLFLAKYKDDNNSLDRSYDNYSEIKSQKYMLGFANERGCVKMISNTHLYEGTDLEKLFTDNQDKAVPVYPRAPDMFDVWDMVQCTTDPTSSDSTFI